MTSITTILGTDVISTSRTTINTNFANLNSDKLETNLLDTDNTLSADSNLLIPSQKAVKSYVDTQGGANASETVRGVVEEATEAEVVSGASTGGTGAKLFVTPAKLKATGLNPVVRTYLTAGSPATWTNPTGLKYIIVELVGGGGGGGGQNNDHAAAGGGGGGGYSRKLIAVATLGVTETVTTGAGGIAGISTGGTGGTGGTSSLGAHLSGAGGLGGIPSDNVSGGAGGAGSSGDINIKGGDGGNISVEFTGSETAERGGYGGASHLGGSVQATNDDVAGSTGLLYGGGGSGAKAPNGGGNRAGGVGAAGIVIVTEYYV